MQVITCVVFINLLFASQTFSRKIGGKVVGEFDILNNIIVIGGDDGETSVEYLEIPSGRKYGDLDEGEDTFATVLQDFNVTIVGGVAAAFKYTKIEMIIVCGGEQNGIVTADCWVKDEKRGPWRKGPAMPAPRKNAASWSNGYRANDPEKKLIVMGGINEFGTTIDSTVIFWPENGTWTFEPALTLPVPDEDFSLTWNFVDFLKTGGSTGQFSAVLFNYTRGAGDFLSIDNFPNLTQSRTGHVSFTTLDQGLGNHFVVAGGDNSFGQPSRRTSEIYSEKKKQWERGPNLPRDFAHGCLIQERVAGTTYLIGGHPTDGRVIMYKNKQFHLTNIRLKKPRERCVCALVPDEVDVGAPEREEKKSSGNMNKGFGLVTPVILTMLYLLK